MADKNVISYALTWENEINSIHFRLMFLNKMANSEDARIRAESTGPIANEIDILGGQLQTKSDFLCFNMGN